MVNNERTVQTRKSSSEQQQQNAGRIPSRPKCVCKFADWAIISNAVLCILQSG